jgi:hypothetical protein
MPSRMVCPGFKNTGGFLAKDQRPDGGVGVGAYAESNPQPAENSMSDTTRWYLYAEEPKASYDYAAAASHLAVALDRAGLAELGKPYLESARRAYDWAGKNLRDGDDGKCRDERLHASAALYQATGELAFEQAFKKDLLIATPATMLMEYEKHDQRWGVWTYVLTNRPGMDADTFALSHNADFIAVVNRSWKGYLESGGTSLEEVRRKHGIKRQPSRRRRPRGR